MKFNIVITCRDRKEYLKRCLFYINIANQAKKHDVTVYVVHNVLLGPTSLKNVKVVSMFVRDKEKFFNKSKYINRAIRKMRREYDYFLQWDVDLIMNPELFDDLEKNGADWTVLSGEKLTKESTEYLKARKLKYDNIRLLGKDNKSINENKMNRYVGNIAVRKETLELYMDILGLVDLYDERFAGWGGEDSMLSITSSKMQPYGLFKKIYFYDAWQHMHHVREMEKPDFDKRQQQKNLETLNNQMIRNENLIRKWVNDSAKGN